MSPAAAPIAAPRRGYSRFVGQMRWLLPALALALVVLIGAWPQLVGSIAVPSLGVPIGEPMVMSEPRYVGRTRDAQPFTVEAQAARLDPAAPDRITLESMRAGVTTASGRDLALSAADAVYDRSRQELRLDGGVALESTDGYRFSAESAQVDLAQGRVVGKTPIDGAGPTGTIRADRFEFARGGDQLRFSGRVRVVLPPPAETTP
jgi:lipopolysaccharide export system protein LptC